MGTAFDGNWKDLEDKEITITSSGDLLTVRYAGGRGPFSGFTVNIGTPVIYVNFTDHSPFTGVLSVASKVVPEAQSKIYWSNGTVWTRMVLTGG